ncbi:amidohydrolase [Promicromonospora sp. MS192]|uniref:amidohydrolase n=1 Tax=Promicromonospora sp. MS192 TaxID=3412684 RepID=UPI003C2C6899
MTTPPPLILRDVRLHGVAGPRDVLVSDGRVARIAPAGALDPGRDPELWLDGRYLVPGLWDAHVHFTQWVVRRERIDLAPAGSATAAVALMRAALPASDADVVVGYGFRDALWTDPPTLAALDELAPDRAVVLVSGDLHSGWFNSAAGRRLGIDLPPDGMLRETEWMGTLEALDRGAQPGVAAYRAAADAAARRGVVGVVEFENADNASLWPARVAEGVTALRVEASIWPERLDAAIERGLRTGDRLDEGGLVTFGRLKVVVDGSLNTRTAYCRDPYPGLDPADPGSYGVLSVDPARLTDLLRTAHDHGIAPAVHAIGDRATTQVLDTFENLGISGVIEHAQLVAAGDFERFGRLGIVASVQPEHAMDDRDVADRHWPGRTGRAFAFRSLLDAGATLQLGSDAPVAPLDPWQALAAAVSRARDGREAWHPEQALPVSAAFAASTRGRLTVSAGDVADLVVLDVDPLTASPDELRRMPVAATMLGGRWTWYDLPGEA